MFRDRKNNNSDEASNQEDLDVDDVILKHVKAIGLWQISITVLLGLGNPPLVTLNNFFGNKPQSHRCLLASDKQWTHSGDGCSLFVNPEESIPCPDGFVYNTTNRQFPDPVIITWDLVCERSWMVPFMNSSYVLSTIFGFVFGGSLGSHLGRRRSITLLCIMQMVFSFSCSLATHYWMFIFLRFLLGFSMSSLFNVSTILIGECTVKTSRSFYLSLQFFLAGFLGKNLIVLFAFLSPSWRVLNAVSSCLPVIGILNIFLTPESPRWLLSSQRFREAVETLHHGYRWNRMFFDKRTPQEHKETEEYFEHLLRLCDLKMITSSNTIQEIEIKKLHRNQIFKRKFWCSKQIYLCTSLTALATFTRFGLGFYARLTKDCIYLVTFLNATMEIPSQLIAYFSYKKFQSRRVPLLVANLLTFVVLSVPAIYAWSGGENMDLAEIICVNMAIILAQACSSMIIVYILESFSVQNRSEGLGMATGLGRIAAVFSDFVNELDSITFSGFALLFYGFCSMLGVLIVACNSNPDTEGNDTVRLSDTEKRKSSQPVTTNDE